MNEILTGSDSEIEFTLTGSNGLPLDLSGTASVLVVLTQSIKTIGKFATVATTGYNDTDTEITDEPNGVFVVRLNSSLTDGLDQTYINAEIAVNVTNGDYEDGIFTQKVTAEKIAIVRKSKIS
tara:strand:+ start:10703 stop:11071 length:369 start_codon:yes stop_codon:yes gene_type:complete